MENYLPIDNRGIVFCSIDLNVSQTNMKIKLPFRNWNTTSGNELDSYRKHNKECGDEVIYNDKELLILLEDKRHMTIYKLIEKHSQSCPHYDSTCLCREKIEIKGTCNNCNGTGINVEVNSKEN